VVADEAEDPSFFKQVNDLFGIGNRVAGVPRVDVHIEFPEIGRMIISGIVRLAYGLHNPGPWFTIIF
jgi:hypothetical protein